MARPATTGWLGRHKVTKNVETTKNKVRNSLFISVFSPSHGKHRQKTTRPVASKDASISPSGLRDVIYRLSLGKDNAQSNTKTSLQKLAKFSAEVGGVLCRSWRSSLQKYYLLSGVDLNLFLGVLEQAPFLRAAQPTAERSCSICWKSFRRRTKLRVRYLSSTTGLTLSS